MSNVEQEILKNLLMQLAKSIEKMNDSIRSLNHSIDSLDRTGKEMWQFRNFLESIKPKEK